MQTDRPTVAAVAAVARAYKGRALHLVLDDYNVSDADVAFCAAQAAELNDADGVHLAQLLARQTRSQRARVARTYTRLPK